MKVLQPQLDSIFRSDPHFRHRGFGVIQQVDDTKLMFSLLGPDSKRLSGSRESGELAHIA